MKLLILGLVLLGLTSCSLVQWMPTSDCQEIYYQRIDNEVSLEAKCRV